MTKITRRSFLKGAGVAALAVAAAGMMTGCAQDKVPGTDIPDVPTVTSKTVNVYFFDADFGIQLPEYTSTMSVLKDATAVNTDDIPASIIPEGYHIEESRMLEIREHGENDLRIYVFVKANTQEVEVTLQIMNPIDSTNTLTVKVNLPLDATTVKASNITLPEGYEWAPGMEDAERPFGVPFMIQRIVA